MTTLNPSIEAASVGATAQLDGPHPSAPLKNGDYSKILPSDKPWPAWALMMFEALPETTAAMVRMDYVHREQNPLGKILYGKVRWVASNANQCDYTKRYAEADLRRAGLCDAEIKQLAGSWRELPEIDRQILTFARKMTLAAYSVTDEEVDRLHEHFGPEKLVSLVHTLAHANFQDRVILALGIEVEPDGPLPALDLRLDPVESARLLVPPRLAAREITQTAPELYDRPHWVGEDRSSLEQALDQQKERLPRIPLAPMERFAAYPPEVQKRVAHIRWGRVSLGYSPQLTQAWYDCMNNFDKEAALDQVFANTYFWVITRSNQCFY